MSGYLIVAALGAAFGGILGWVLGTEIGCVRYVCLPPREAKPRRGGKLGSRAGITQEELAQAIRERVAELEREGA
jgi:membrane protein YqaA with SNARE-associated domain